MKNLEPPPHVKDLVKFFSTKDTQCGNKGLRDSRRTLPAISRFEYNIRPSTSIFNGRIKQITELHDAIQANKNSGQNLTVVTQDVEVNSLGGVDSEIVSRVYTSLQNSKCLIIFDNFESVDLSEFLPPEDDQGKPMILIITSNPMNWSQEPILIDGLTSEEGALYLERELKLEPSDRPLSKVFTELCNGLPLGLQIAVSLMDIIPEGEDENSNFLQNFVESFASEQELYLTRRVSDSVTNITVAVLMQMAEKELLEEEHGELANKVSEMLAFLSSVTHKQVLLSLFPTTEVSSLSKALELLTKYAIIRKFDMYIEIHPHIQAIIIEKIQARDASCTLTSPCTETVLLEELTSNIHLGLISRTLDQQMKWEYIKTGISIVNHTKNRFLNPAVATLTEIIATQLVKLNFRESYRLFHEILDFHLTTLLPQCKMENTLESVSTALQNSPSDNDPAFESPASITQVPSTDNNCPQPEELQSCKEFLKKILESKEEPSSKKLAATQILGYILYMQGRYEKALEVFQEVSKTQNQFWGSQHLEFLTTENTIGTLLVDLHEYEAAFEVYSGIYEAFKSKYGMEHPFTITIECNISVVLQRLEKYTDAYESYENVLKKQEKVLEKDDPAILRSKTNMAVILELQGFHDEALDLFLEILHQQMTTLGSFHADTLLSAHNIASILDILGYTDEALEIYRDVSDGRMQILGEFHKDTLSTLHNMALLLDKTKCYAEAISIYKRAYASRTEILGADHKDTLNTLYNMAVALENNQSFDEAYQTYSKVHAIFQTKLGPEHPATFYCLLNMALVLQSLEKYQDALELYQHIYEDQRRILGDLHEDTLSTRHDMAAVLDYQGNWNEAYVMYSDVFESRKLTLGEEHPDTLATMHQMASMLESLGHYEEASQIYSKVLEKQMQALGREHVDTLTTEHNKTIVDFHQRNYSEALEMYKKVYEIRRKALGPVHPETLSTQHNIGLVLIALEQFSEALVIFEEVYDNRKDILGPKHLDTLRTRQNLAQVLKKLNRLSESLDILTEVYDSRKKVLGDAHPETVRTKNKMKAIYKARDHVQSQN
ncbi:unnamed protein product [Allacma fusca]|uniref:Kinesin light chain n=1 Tax=Allacma fusca TaxID=39272 RepID=A0A8J2P437_9HEXA|nr:unnamed protein product [Allacma fusca]